jgi:preprotein translocase subunit YajC
VSPLPTWGGDRPLASASGSCPSERAAIVRNPFDAMVILAYFAVIAVAFFLLIVIPQRRRTNAHRAVLASLEIGEEVVTIGGILGTIRELNDERIELEVAEGVVITVARNAIAQVVAPDEPAVNGNGNATANGDVNEG